MITLIKEVQGDEIIAKITKIEGDRRPYRVTFHDVDTNERIDGVRICDTLEQAEGVIVRVLAPKKVSVPV